MSSNSPAGVQVTLTAETLACHRWSSNHGSQRAAARQPDRTAVEAPDGRLTYAELRRGARRAAARGLERAASSSTRGRGSTSSSRSTPACWRARAPCRSTRGSARPSARGSATPRRRPGGAYVGHHRHAAARGLTKQDIEAQARGTAVALGLTDDERWLCPLPLSHVGGLMVLLRSAVYGTTAVLGPPDTPNVTLASPRPHPARAPARRGTRSRRARAVLLGGAPADPTLLQRARDAGWPVAPSYGLTADVLGGDDRRDR